MKRPEGFDPPSASQQPRRPPIPRSSVAPKNSRTSKDRVDQPPAPGSASATSQHKPAPRSTPRPRPQQPQRIPTRNPRPDAAARADLRKAARARRKFERAEVRRFTRRARNRRIVFAAVGGVIVTLALLVVTAVYSPLLALRTVAVDGTSRLDPTAIVAAVSDQLGTPLALLNYDRMTSDLAGFPLIRSYVTEIVPPDTLLIHVSERQPVGSIAAASGFDLVDPAGVVVQQSAERIPGVPLINIAGAAVTDPSFAAVVEVLLALPPELLSQVDTITATTKDDVNFTLVGVGQGVHWGSADESDRKAALLAGLIAVIGGSRTGTFDVSAPGNGVFRPA
ncbi:MAG: FtsQ-type POTRA domain-containing protein [Salinibacterium sp.]|nr:FtsQ-type POTRA domain-containing protein [Salinibacterium sp.]